MHWTIYVYRVMSPFKQRWPVAGLRFLWWHLKRPSTLQDRVCLLLLCLTLHLGVKQYCCGFQPNLPPQNRNNRQWLRSCYLYKQEDWDNWLSGETIWFQGTWQFGANIQRINCLFSYVNLCYTIINNYVRFTYVAAPPLLPAEQIPPQPWHTQNHLTTNTRNPPPLPRHASTNRLQCKLICYYCIIHIIKYMYKTITFFTIFHSMMYSTYYCNAQSYICCTVISYCFCICFHSRIALSWRSLLV